MSEPSDPLDEEFIDPLDEAAWVPDDTLVRGGSCPDEGFLAEIQKGRERAARQVASKPPVFANKVTERRKRSFLQALAQTGNVSLSAAKAGWSVNTARTLRSKNADFALSWDIALETAADFVEAELYRRAVHGVQEDVWHKPKDGEPTVIGHVTKYSDQLMMQLIKGLKPEKYRERQEVKHEGSKGGVLLLPAVVPLDEWEAASAAQQAQYREQQEDPT